MTCCLVAERWDMLFYVCIQPHSENGPFGPPYLGSHYDRDRRKEGKKNMKCVTFRTTMGVQIKGI
jgi:hypothetical protein